MIGFTISRDQLRGAPREVRGWIEHEVIAALGARTAAVPPAQTAHIVSCSVEEAAAVLVEIRGMLPAANVFLEFGRPASSIGQPSLLAFRLIDILHHTRLESVEQVMECLEFINQALSKVRHDESAKFCGFDSEGHCFVTPDTQTSIATLWRRLLGNQQNATAGEAA
jgi:hypothetical protein